MLSLFYISHAMSIVSYVHYSYMSGSWKTVHIFTQNNDLSDAEVIGIAVSALVVGVVVISSKKISFVVLYFV